MNLRAVRIKLVLLYGLFSAVAIGALAWVAATSASGQARARTETDAQAVVADLAIQDYWSDDVVAPNTWLAQPDPVSPWQQAKGPVTVDAPVATFAARVLDMGTLFAVHDDDWLLHGRVVEPGTVLVTAADLNSGRRTLGRTVTRIAVASATVWAGSLVAGYWLSGRSLEPARAAASQQRSFITDAAHELRTPLSIIQASASQTLQRDREPEEYRVALGEIRFAALRASAGVNQLLELARLEAGHVEPRRASLRFDLLVEEVGSTAGDDQCEVVSLSADPIVVEADHDLLRQAIETITTNATNRASRVVLSTEQESDLAFVTIADNGPGFDQATLDEPFTRFARNDGRGSSGLGMAIARSIIELHGGRYAAFNDPLGGAVVRLGVPVNA